MTAYSSKDTNYAYAKVGIAIITAYRILPAVTIKDFPELGPISSIRSHGCSVPTSAAFISKDSCTDHSKSGRLVC